MEWPWLLVLTAVAVSTLWRPLRRISRWGWLVGCVLVAALVSAGLIWNNRLQRRSQHEQQWAAKLPVPARPGGYISSDKCESCHPREYSTWHRTFHRTMTQVATGEAVLGNFENVTLQLEGGTY